MTGGSGGSAKPSYEMETRSVVAPGQYGHSGQQPGPVVRETQMSVLTMMSEHYDPCEHSSADWE